MAKSDNNFAKAFNLGAFTGKSAKKLVFKGDLLTSDKVDFFQFSIRQGASLSGANLNRFRIRGGNARLSAFVESPLLGNRPLPLGSIALKAGSNTTDLIAATFNDFVGQQAQANTTIFFKFDKPSRAKVNYDLRITFVP